MIQKHFSQPKNVLIFLQYTGIWDYPKDVLHDPYMDAEALETALFDALPNITEMGTLTQKLQLSFSGNSKTREGSFTLPVLEISSRDFGITGKAGGTMDKTKRNNLLHIY